METLQVVKGTMDGRVKWGVVRVKSNFQGATICSSAFDTFKEAAAEMHRIYLRKYANSPALEAQLPRLG